MKTCLFDMDGVAARTHYALETELKKTYPKFTLENVHTYNFNKELGNKEIEKLTCPIDVIFKTFRNPEVFRNAELEPSFLQFLEENKNKYKYIIHSLAFTEEVAKVKQEWLEEKLKDKLKYFEDIKIVVGNSKPALPGIDFVFEDSLKQLQKYSVGYPKTNLILYNMPFNQEEYNPEYKEIFEKCKRIYSFLD